MWSYRNVGEMCKIYTILGPSESHTVLYSTAVSDTPKHVPFRKPERDCQRFSRPGVGFP